MNIIDRARSALARRNSFGADLLTQSSGTILSQLVPIAIAPLLTRIFTPVDFGLYGTVLSVATLLAIFITLRIEHGVMIVESDERAKATAFLAAFLAFSGALLFAFCAAAILAVFGMLDGYHLLIWCLLTPLCAFSSSVLRITTLFSNRMRLFKHVSKARIAQAFCTAIISIALGVFAPQSHGLILSLIIGNVLYVAYLARSLWPPVTLTRADALGIIGENGKFIRFSLPADLINSLSSRLPFIIFPALYGLEQTGFLALAYRVIATPARFVGTAIGEVFYSHAARQYQKTGSCWLLVRNVALLLAAVGIAGFAVLFILAQPLFSIVFGEQWLPAASFTQILTPMLLIAFIVSPLSAVFYIAARQKEDLLWQTAFLVATGSACFVGLWTGGATASLMAFSCAGSLLYIVYFILIRHYAGGREQGPG